MHYPEAQLNATEKERKNMKIARLLLRRQSEAATLFLTDRAGPGRFIICDLSRSDCFRGR